jgi:hypothetical protein
VWVHPASAKDLDGVREMLAPPEHLRFRRVESYDLGQHEEDLTLLLHAWPDIEEALLRQADDEGASNYRRDQAGALAAALRRAFRVEVQLVEGMFLERELGDVVLFDVNDYDARQGAATFREQRSTLDSLVYKHAQTQGSRPVVRVQIVPSGKPIGGEVCPRVMVTPKSTADLRDLPEPEPPATSVPLVTRGLHKLTPIEAPIYDVLQETDLVFAVQPRVQGEPHLPTGLHRLLRRSRRRGRTRRAQVYKSREQRSHDYERQLWFEKKGIPVVRFTGGRFEAPDRCSATGLAERCR